MVIAVVLAVAFALPLGYGALVLTQGPRSPLNASSSPPPTAAAPPSGIVAEPGPTFASALPSAPPDGHRYYVDCDAGSDDGDGTSPADAWSTLDRASHASLAPGDELLLLAGCKWQGPLVVTSHGTPSRYITIGSYGTGAAPLIQNGPEEEVEVEGSYIVVEDMTLRTFVPSRDAGCDNAPAGRIVGVRMAPGSDHVIVRAVDASGFFSAIRIERGSSFDRVLDNVLHGNDMKSDDITSDAGATGVDVQGDDNEVAGNRISGSDTCSRWFGGHDGSAVSIFGGQRNLIHDNVTWDNNGFIEVGDPRASDTIIAYNQDTSTLENGTYIVVHGIGTKYGPVARTTVVNNSAYLTGRNSFGVQCTGQCPASILSFRNNILWTEDRIAYGGDEFDEAGNIYWRSNGVPTIYFTMSASSRIADPRFADAAGRDLSLLAGSPAIDAASDLALSLGLDQDIIGTAVPQGAGPDIGAYEWTP